MSSSHTPIHRDRMVDGIDRGVRPHQIGDNAWYDHFNMRVFEGYVRQVPRKKVSFSVLQNTACDIEVLQPIPVRNKAYSLMIALSQECAFRVSSAGSVPLLEGDAIAAFTRSEERWGTCFHNDRLFFTNPLNAVRWCDGSTVKAIGTDVPSGRYVTVFYEHVFVGGSVYRGIDLPHRMMWSNLYDLSDFNADSDTEGDHFDFVIKDKMVGGVAGITGQGLLGDLMFVYTPNGVHRLSYVGLPKVVRVDELPFDVGCGFKRSMVEANGCHYFIDASLKTFFMFNGMAPTDIGQNIRNLFFADLKSGYEQLTYGYEDRTYREIHWVYVSNTSDGEFDREVVFNWKTGKWWHGSVENVHCFAQGGPVARTIDELTGTISSYTQAVNTLDESGVVLGRIYGANNGLILVEEGSGDTNVNLINAPLPVLETKDYHYDDLQTVKESSSMVIHSAYAEAAGVDVFHARRSLIDDAVTFVQEPQIWTPTLREQRLSFPRTSGRLLRYRFRPRGVEEQEVVETTYTAPSSFSLRAEIAKASEVSTDGALCGTYDGDAISGGHLAEWTLAAKIASSATPPQGAGYVTYYWSGTVSGNPINDLQFFAPLFPSYGPLITYINQVLVTSAHAYYDFPALFPGKTFVRLYKLVWCFDGSPFVGLDMTTRVPADVVAQNIGSQTSFTEGWHLNVVFVVTP